MRLPTNAYAKHVQRCWKRLGSRPQTTITPTPANQHSGQHVEGSGPFLSMNYFNETPAVPFGSTDLNQGLTSLLTGRGDVRQMRLPNQQRSEDKFTTLQIATYNVLTLSDESHLVELERRLKT